MTRHEINPDYLRGLTQHLRETFKDRGVVDGLLWLYMNNRRGAVELFFRRLGNAFPGQYWRDAAREALGDDKLRAIAALVAADRRDLADEILIEWVNR